MGNIVRKKKRRPCKEVDFMGLMEKIKLLQDEIHEIKHLREMECRTHKQQVSIIVWREAEWKREKKKLKEEVRRLRKELAAKEEIIQGMEDGIVAGKNEKQWQRQLQLLEDGIVAGKNEKQWQRQLQLLGSNFLVEHMREEQARRDEAVEKWKRLYIAIKTELDTIIQRAHQGGLYCWEEEKTIEALTRELKGKEETVQDLKAKVATMEKEGIRKEREVDILKQSLRILSSKRRVIHATKGLIRSFRM